MNDHPTNFSRYFAARPLRRTKFFSVSASAEKYETRVIATPNTASDLNEHQRMEARFAPPNVNERGQTRTLPQRLAEKREHKQLKPLAGTRPWRPGTFGFDSEDGDPGFDIDSTIPMMVLKGISARQGQSVPGMKSEISGAAGAAAVVGAGNIGGTLLKYGSNLMIQRGFGAGAFGIYSLSMSIVTLVASIFNLGLENAMVRYVSIYRSKKQTHSLQGLAIFCTALAGTAGLVGALLLLYLAPIYGTAEHLPGVIPLLQALAPMVPLMCMQVIWFGGLQGFRAFKWRLLSQRIFPSVVLILLLAGVLLFLHDLVAVALATLASTLVSAVFGLYYFFQKIAHFVEPGSEHYELREWLAYASANFLTSVIDVVLESIDTLLLAFFAVSAVGIGQYSAALKISVFISMPLISLNAMFAPTIAELHARGEVQKLTTMFRIVTKWSISLSLPIFGIATLFSVPLLGISGSSFVSGWPLLVTFSIDNMINTGTGSVGYMLLMTGHQKLSFLNSIAAVIVNVVLGIILTPHFGAMGVAISTGLAYTVANLARLLQVRLLLKTQPYSRDTLKPLMAGVISALLTGALLYLMSTANLSIRIFHIQLSIELLLIPVFLATYVGLILLFKISPDDKIVVDALRKKLRRGKK